MKPYHLFVEVERDPYDGSWFVYVASRAHRDVVGPLRVTVDLFESTQGENVASDHAKLGRGKAPKFSFTGAVHDASKSFEDVRWSGEFLHLFDSQGPTL